MSTQPLSLRRASAAIALTAVAALVGGLAAAPAQAQRPQVSGTLHTVTGGLDGPRGVVALGHGRTLVAESDGKVVLVRERRHRPASVRTLTTVPADFAPAIAIGRRGTVFILTGGAAPGSARADGATTLYRWRPGYAKPRVVADIAKYQAHDPDPYDLEKNPTDTNPFGVAALRDGTVLVADAAGNDLLRVWPNGRVRTVARLKPRVVKVPPGLPATDPESGQPIPPAGTRIPSEAVATSVTVGADGFWYVGELRGFPATAGTSEIWRIKPGSRGAVCNPARPYAGHCRRYADGLTSLVALSADRRGNIYAVTLSKQTWLAAENPHPTPESLVGALYQISPYDRKVRELARNSLTLPGGVDVAPRGAIYVTGPVFGKGTLQKLLR